MKLSTLRAEVTVDQDTKILAVIISLLKPMGHFQRVEILRVVANRFGCDLIVR